MNKSQVTLKLLVSCGPFRVDVPNLVFDIKYTPIFAWSIGVCELWRF